MLKLMKYEFRKMRTVLLGLLIALLALDIGFLFGFNTGRDTLSSVCFTLIFLLVFVVYVCILISGIVSYSRELRDKSGYLIFMTPVRPIGIVVSKLLFTALTALVCTALFGFAALMNFRLMLGRLDLDPEVLDQVNMVLRLGLKSNATIQQILQTVAFSILTLLIEVMLTMCTAYLAITLSATLLQNRKGFLRVLISFALFIALTWGSGWLTQKLIYDRMGMGETLSQMSGILAVSLLFNIALCALYAWASSWLLSRKVNL